jgi:hypothetical protein
MSWQLYNMILHNILSTNCNELAVRRQLFILNVIFGADDDGTIVLKNSNLLDVRCLKLLADVLIGSLIDFKNCE